MVYPHSNDLGDQKPPAPTKALWEDMFDQEMQAIKSSVLNNQLAKYVGPVAQPAAKKNGKTTMAMLDELIKETYLNPVAFPKWEQPKLIPPSTPNWTFHNSFDEPIAASAPIPIGEYRIEIKLPDTKTIGCKMMFPISHEGMTEEQLRAQLTNMFVSMTNDIISNLKKEKDIK